MNQANLKSRLRSHPGCISMAAVLIGLVLSVSPSWGQNVIDADADGILMAMTNHLKSLQAFTVDYDTDHEIVDLAGQKLQYSASGSVQASRGDGFYMTRKGPFADVELTFDGKLISLYGKGMNVYTQLDSPGASIDEAVEEFRVSTGLDVAGADFLVTDPYAVLTEGATSGRLVGDAFVGGVECDQLAFRSDDVDWQIWISKGAEKLPVKYVITTKWVTGAPQYSLRFSNWKSGGVDAKLFSFKAPANAKKLERIDSDEVGELMLEGSK